MKLKWLFLILLLGFWAGPVSGEVIHLFTGERITGRIVQVEEDSLSVESTKGFGVIQIPKNEISLIEFEKAQRNLERKMGFGYYHRTTPNTQDGSALEYAVDSFSVKYWLSPWAALDFLVGFFNYDQSGTTQFEVYSVEIRYLRVFDRKTQFDFYWGLSGGWLTVIDNTLATPIDDTGTTYRGFLGAEVFFLSMPGLGFSAEVGIGSQSVGEREITSISTTTFPTFSMRYYF